METTPKKIKTHPLTWLLIIAIAVATVWIVYDILFDKPEFHEGVIVSMEYIPGKMQSGQYHMGSRSRPQLISSQARDRWIATVKMDDGNIFKVNCKLHHFENKQVGDVLRFKSYNGGSLGIHYFAHNDELEDAK
ncbi:MAG TPA: hypothetical protein DIS90_03390 [Cytophagales bacterium]|nr:hypothetical protein [Cytophagales bacterium]HCR54993.1 hypothetical protein [Cytophagales bacterium]